MGFQMQYRNVIKYSGKGNIFIIPEISRFLRFKLYKIVHLWSVSLNHGHHGRTRGITDCEPRPLSDYIYYKLTLRFLTQPIRLQDDVPVHR